MLQLLDKSRETYRVLYAVATLKCWQEAEQERELAEAATAKAKAATAKAEAATAKAEAATAKAEAATAKVMILLVIAPWPFVSHGSSDNWKAFFFLAEIQPTK